MKCKYKHCTHTAQAQGYCIGHYLEFLPELLESAKQHLAGVLQHTIARSGHPHISYSPGCSICRAQKFIKEPYVSESKV